VKIISSDPTDTIIKDFASLKTGISLNVISDFKANDILKSESEYNFSEELLDIIIPNKKEYNEFYVSLSYVIEKVKFYNYTEKEINVQVPQVTTPSASPRQDGRVEINYGKLQEDYKNINSRESDVILTTDDNSSRLKDESKVLLSVRKKIN
jgi:hypothetical protein